MDKIKNLKVEIFDITRKQENLKTIYDKFEALKRQKFKQLRQVEKEIKENNEK